MRRWGWRAYLAFGAVLAVTYYLIPPEWAKLVIWPVIGLSSAAAILVGAWWNHPNRPLAWYLFALGQVLFVLGDFLYAVRISVLHEQTVAFPSPVDFLYLAFYPCLVGGLLLLIRARSPGRDTASLIDATIIATGLALLSWVFLIGPEVRDPELSMLQRVVSIAYPLADVLVLAVAARLAVGAGHRPGAWRVLMVSVLGLLASDVAFGLLQIAGTWQWGGPVDIGWIVFYIGFGVAALHPSMVVLSQPAPVSVRLPRGRLVLITCASLISPAVLVIQSARGAELEVPMIAAASVVLFLLALARMSGLAGELAFQHERKRVMQSVLRMTEAERMRLAAELHDGPVQQLTAMLYGLELVRHHVRHGSPSAADEVLASLEDKASSEIHGLRRLMTQLRPPVLDELGLVTALQNQGMSFESASGVACAIETEPELNLQPELETVLYRVTQESLANIRKHANASCVNISLAANDGRVRLLIRDDGVGFDPSAASAMVAQGHFGLINMRERVEMVGGKLQVVSTPGEGTTIAVEMSRRIASP
jgi:signal transduction histidine kinase